MIVIVASSTDPPNNNSSSAPQRIEWFASDDDISLCRIKGKSADQCQNYIKVLKWINTDNSLFLCGTNAYRPRCRTYALSVSKQAAKTNNRSF